MIGIWMQTVGAQWLLVAGPNAATLVALVQTAAMAPTLLLALPAGALATSSTAADCCARSRSRRDRGVRWPPGAAAPRWRRRVPVVVITYTVPPPRVTAFLRAMAAVRWMRLRTGAQSWTLHRDGAAPDHFVEIATYPTWAEHLRQHTGRLTGRDRVIDETAATLTDGPPRVQHLFPAQHESTTRSG